MKMIAGYPRYNKPMLLVDRDGHFDQEQVAKICAKLSRVLENKSWG